MDHSHLKFMYLRMAEREIALRYLSPPIRACQLSLLVFSGSTSDVMDVLFRSIDSMETPSIVEKHMKNINCFAISAACIED